jgi:hypothetical protein
MYIKNHIVHIDGKIHNYKKLMRYQINISALLCLTVLLLGCKQNTPSRIEYGKSFEEMVELAGKEGKYFGIVLSSSECSLCETLHKTLFDDVALAVGKKAVFNIVNITLPQNRWYQQFIASMAQPVTLVFSPNAELKAIISGASRASTECIKDVLGGELECVQYL